jgi:hypothetical protein
MPAQTEPSTSADLEMLEKAVGGARSAGITDSDAGMQSLLRHVAKVRAQLGLADSQAPQPQAPGKQPAEQEHASESGHTEEAGAGQAHKAQGTQGAEGAEGNASSDSGARMHVVGEAADVGGHGDGSCAAAGSCVKGVGEAGAKGGEGGGKTGREAPSASPGAGPADDDDLPALDLYADDEAGSKKKRRRRKKRK